MQQVKFKKGSMEEARHGNDRDYYLFAINGDYCVIKSIDGNRWHTQTVNLVALEAAVPAVVLPVGRGYELDAIPDILFAMIQTVFNNEVEFTEHFQLDGALVDGGVDCFYMAGERCFVRYECDGIMHETTIRTKEFIAWHGEVGGK